MPTNLKTWQLHARHLHCGHGTVPVRQLWQCVHFDGVCNFDSDSELDSSRTLTRFSSSSTVIQQHSMGRCISCVIKKQIRSTIQRYACIVFYDAHLIVHPFMFYLYIRCVLVVHPRKAGTTYAANIPPPLRILLVFDSCLASRLCGGGGLVIGLGSLFLVVLFCAL